MTNNHLSPRTIREWLELIPFDRARKEAIEKYEKDGNHFRENLQWFTYPSLSKSLIYGFGWGDSDELEYWRRLYNSIKNMEQSVKLKNQEPPMMGMSY